VGPQREITVIADRSVAAMNDFVCGANEAGYHLTGVNFGRDLEEPASVADIRNAVAGDPSPDGKGRLEICRGIEVGHIFQLGSKYSKAMSATFLDESGKTQVMEMGCYGIGVSRIVAAAIEQGNDERGIIWPLPMAPFQVAIAPIGYRKNAEVRNVADRLHDELQSAGIEVLLDDRDERPGAMFADLELIGVPHRITVGERGLKDEKLEYQARTDASAKAIELQSVPNLLKSLL
jgi:prolyl-tRNA synthetase